MGCHLRTTSKRRSPFLPACTASLSTIRPGACLKSCVTPSQGINLIHGTRMNMTAGPISGFALSSPFLRNKTGGRSLATDVELSDSVSNLSLHFSVVCFRQLLMLPGEVSFNLGFSVVDTHQLCQVVRQLISHSRQCLFEPSQLSSDLVDPHGVDWLIINRCLNFCALTCAVCYAGEVHEFDVIKVAREGFICPLERRKRPGPVSRQSGILDQQVLTVA